MHVCMYVCMCVCSWQGPSLAGLAGSSQLVKQGVCGCVGRGFVCPLLSFEAMTFMTSVSLSSECRTCGGVAFSAFCDCRDRCRWVKLKSQRLAPTLVNRSRSPRRHVNDECRISKSDRRINWHYYSSTYDLEATTRLIQHMMSSDGYMCGYIGICKYVTSRWFGDPSRDVPGHSNKWKQISVRAAVGPP